MERLNIKRSLKIILFLVLFNYFGLPAIAGVNNAVHKLSEVSLPWLGYSTWHLYTRLVDREAIAARRGD